MKAGNLIIRKELYALAKGRDPERVSRYFKTEEGSYGAHDRFLGVTVPELRVLSKKYHDLEFADIEILLASQFNEERLLALIILVNRYKKTEGALQKKIYQFYVKNMDAVNNWNLVDLSARDIVGAQLWQEKTFERLNKWINSRNLWYRRIAVVSTHYFILQDHFDTTLQLAEKCFDDTEDLMHKATGWMLREVGKRNRKVLVDFLKEHQHKMPSVMRSYAREHLKS